MPAISKKQILDLKEQFSKLKNASYKWKLNDDCSVRLRLTSGEIINCPDLPLRPYQIEIANKILREGYRKVFWYAPRRGGKEVLSIELIIICALIDPGQYYAVYPDNKMARRILWRGDITMADRTIRKYMDLFPGMFVLSKREDDMYIQMSNGSLIQVIGSHVDADSLRGINVKGVFLSEFAFSDPYALEVLTPSIANNKGWIVIQSTPNGYNHAEMLYEQYSTDPEWYCRRDTCLTLLDEKGQRYIGEDIIEDARRSGMEEWQIQREYYCKVQLNPELIYFAEPLVHLKENGKIIPGLILHASPVYCAWDIGWNDKTSIVFFQIDEASNPVIIHYLEHHNKTYEYYIQECEKFCRMHNLILKGHFLPHDGKNGNQQTGTTNQEHIRRLLLTMHDSSEIQVKSMDQPADKLAAIQAMRRMLFRCRFNKSSNGANTSGIQGTERLIKCLSSYTKEYDERKSVYKDQPLHNWASHGVDAFQTMTLAIDGKRIVENVRAPAYYGANIF